MNPKWIIGITAVLVLVAAFGVGYRMGTGSHEQQMIDAKQAGKDFQQQWYAGLDEAQAERGEQQRLDYAQQLKDNEARRIRDREVYDEARDAFDYKSDPHYQETLARMPENQRKAFEEQMEIEWNKAEEERRARRP